MYSFIFSKMTGEVRTWELKDPRSVSYPKDFIEEEDEYDSDDDFVLRGQRAGRAPKPAKTHLESLDCGETMSLVLKIPHSYRDSCFTVDIIVGESPPFSHTVIVVRCELSCVT